MVQRLILLVVVSLTLTLAAATDAYAIGESCSSGSIYTGGCGAGSGSGVDVEVGSSQGGGGGSGEESGGGSGGGDSGGGAEGSGGGGAEVPCVSTNVELCSEMRRVVPDPADAPTTTPVVTTREIAHLVPGSAGQGMEPNGWMVVGLPTNFYADAAPSVVSTTLLGSPAEVRFTPVSFMWDHGDGSSTTSATGGAAWASLGVAEFSETATSHVYDRPGDYTITLTIQYSAEYRIGGGEWRPLAGTVPSTAPPITASAKAAKTVLVADDCGRRRISPGC